MKKAKIILCLFLALLTMFTLIACNASQTGTSPAASSVAPTKASTAPASASAAAPAVKKSEIILGDTGYLGRFLDLAAPPDSKHGCTLVYDALFVIDVATKKPYSRILADWKYTDDTTFVMTLKPGVTFTNGDVATADDLLYSIMSHIERKDLGANNLVDILDQPNCTSDGKLTATLKFKQPYGPGIFGNNYYLYDKAWCKKVGWDSQDWYKNPNGTGPYKVTEYVTDDHFTCVLKDNYWNTSEKYDVKKWTVKYFPDASTLYMSLEKGDIDMCPIYNTADYSRWLAKPNKDIGMNICDMGSNMLFMMGPTSNPILANKTVRQALAIGVDWPAVGKLAVGDLYVQATSSLPKDNPFYKNVGAYKYDPDAAKKLLKDAGFKDGDIKLHIYDMSVDLRKNLNEAFQFYCQQMGIAVNIEYGDIASCLPKWLAPGGCDYGWMNQINGVLTGEPSTSLKGLYAIKLYPWALSDNQALKDKLNLGQNTIGDDKRKPIYQDIQQIIHDNYICIPVYEDRTIVAYRTNVFTADQVKSAAFTSMFVSLHKLSVASK